MKKNTPSIPPATKPRQIVGFSLPRELASEVKIEAAGRNLSLRKLFTELWTLYKKTKLA